MPSPRPSPSTVHPSRFLFAIALAAALFQACSDGSGSPSDDQSDLTSCSGSHLDSKGVCRNKNGQFAKGTCCRDDWTCQNLDIWTNAHCDFESDGSTDWEGCIAKTPAGDLNDLAVDCCGSEPDFDRPMWCVDLLPGCTACDVAQTECLDVAETDDAIAECEDAHFNCTLTEC